MMAHFEWYLKPFSLNICKKINLVRVGPPLAKFSGSAHVQMLVNEHKTDDCRMRSGMMNPGLESRSRVGRLLMSTRLMTA